MDTKSHLYAKRGRNALGRDRLIMVIPSKVVKKAVLRNKMRRRTREILRKNSVNIKKGYDLTFIFKKGSEDLDFKSLENEIKRALGD